MKVQVDNLGKAAVTVEEDYWSPNRDYRELTIVEKEGIFGTYISRIPVPAGTDLSNRKYWIPFSKLKESIVLDYQTFKNSIQSDINTLRAEMESFIKISVSGEMLTDKFGNSEVLGVNQKALSDAFNRVWNKLEDITGEAMKGIDMVVTPTYFIGENGSTIHITANTVDTANIFDHIAFYLNGTLLVEADNIDYFEYDTEITETTVVKCVATILGTEYSRQQIIEHFNSFWLGAGTSYQDVMSPSNIIPITRGMRGSHNIILNDNDYIIIIIGENLENGFARADLNGVEIPFNRSTVTVDDNNYVVFTSVNRYQAGTYNIDINR